jgi:TPR repeat protein
MQLRALFAIAAILSCNATAAGLNEGLDALRRNDFATAETELRPLAERGDAEAQYRIGLMYEYGKGYPQDKAQGIAWFKKSAGLNHAAAQTELGIIYATGDGVAQDNKLAVEWFQKAAPLGNATAQYNLGLLYAKGQGVKLDNAQAIAWWRKAAAQGMTVAQFKLGVAYENGEGVTKDAVLALANYAIAARSGNNEYAKYRDDIAKQLTPDQRRNGLALADAWTVGQPMPGSVSGTTASATAAVKTRCSATGSMGGEKFTATHCVASLFGDAHSVAIWFTEDPITPQEAENFQMSSYADVAKGGKPRTMVTIMFCPGGGQATASAAAVKSIDLNTNHAKSPVAGIQRVVEAPRDFKVEKMTGDIKPGGVLSGRISGSVDRTAFSFDFDVTLPTKDAAAGLSCGK